MESFFSSLKIERCAREVYWTREDTGADLFDYLERSCNSQRRHSIRGYLNPGEFEEKLCQPHPVSGEPAAAHGPGKGSWTVLVEAAVALRARPTPAQSVRYALCCIVLAG